jgi:hypothetical protein
MTGLLDATDLATLRTDLEALLPDTCTINYVTRTADGAGGWTEATTARGTSIACRIMPMQFGAFAGISADQLKEGRAWVLSVANDQTVEIDDQVVVGSNTYHVKQLNTDESEIGLTRAYLERLA